MKRGKYLETVLDALDADLQQMNLDDDYDIYGSKSTNVDDESIMILIDFPNDIIRAFEFPYDEDLETKEDVIRSYQNSDVRDKVQEAILEDAARRCVEITRMPSPPETEDYDEEEAYGDEEEWLVDY